MVDAVGDALAVELGDELVEPVVDWDRVGAVGRAGFTVVLSVIAETLP